MILDVELLSKIVHAMSVCFTSSCHLRTLVPRLARSLAPYLPIVEIEATYLDNHDDEAVIRATETRDGRTWTRTRSARFLHRNYVQRPKWADYVEPARISNEPVETQLVVPVGRRGLLRISFGTDIKLSEEFSDITDMVVELFGDHARRLGQLLDTAQLSRQSHRNPSTPREQQVIEGTRKTEMPVTEGSSTSTEMKVELLDQAISRCISAALHATEGQIYGDAGAAKLLGLKPSTLQSKMRKLGIERQAFVPGSGVE